MLRRGVIMPKTLIFSQDNSLNGALSALLKNNSYEVSAFSDPIEAIKAIRESSYDLVLVDFPGNEEVNHELLTSIHCFHDILPLIVIVDNDKIDVARKAIKNGAVNYITKPWNPGALLLTLTIALANAELRIENLSYRRSMEGGGEPGFIQTSSDTMIKVYALVDRIAKTDSVVWITGEMGTGKKTVALRIHARSQRSDYKFCKVDCAALTANMQETELFGYSREIASQEPQRKQGVFEKNNGGTIFLDNIDALPMSIQIKLLYILQNKKIQLIGSAEMININDRLIVGSTCDLKHKILTGEFCEALYRKISMIPIVLPPLRKRRKDIPNLVEHFLERFTNRNSDRISISSQALAVLCEYDWPGNIGQLKNLIERLVTVNETGRIDVEELPMELRRQIDGSINWDKIVDDKLDDIMPLKKYLQVQEQAYIQKVLEHSGEDKNLAAKKLGISLASFYRKWGEPVL